MEFIGSFFTMIRTLISVAFKEVKVLLYFMYMIGQESETMSRFTCVDRAGFMGRHNCSVSPTQRATNLF